MDINILTLNCAKAQQSSEHFAQLVEEALGPNAPQFLAIGVQEAAPILDASLERIEPYIRPLFKGIESALQSKYPDFPFQFVGDSWAGAIGVIVYGRDEVDDVQAAWTGFGYGWSTLKGAAAVRIKQNDTVLKFVTTHLAANSGQAAARNHGYGILANSLVFEGGDTLFNGKKGNHVFVFGDLNYRAISDIPALHEDSTGENVESEALLSNVGELDELSIERAEGRTLWGLNEAPITFRPTFKFYPGTSKYNMKRLPSWTDRVLYSDDGAKVDAYSSVPSYVGSDHKPVYLRLKVDPDAAGKTIEIPKVEFYSNQVTSSVDRVLAYGLFLTTTKIGYALIGVVFMFFVWYLFM